MKDAYNHRLRLVESAKQRGIQPAARIFATTVPTVRKWVRHFQRPQLWISAIQNAQRTKTEFSRLLAIQRGIASQIERVKQKPAEKQIHDVDDHGDSTNAAIVAWPTLSVPRSSAPRFSVRFAIKNPPNNPAQSPNATSNGSTTTVASTRGVISLRIGSMPKAPIASTCSVTTMEPNSDAIAVPFRPATGSAVNTAPSSRRSASETASAVKTVSPKRLNCDAEFKNNCTADAKEADGFESQRLFFLCF